MAASLKEIQQAAFWSNPNSFISCYLKDGLVGKASFAAAGSEGPLVWVPLAQGQPR